MTRSVGSARTPQAFRSPAASGASHGNDDREGKDAPEPVELGTRFALSLKEAAQAFAISEPHLRNLLPELPHVHLGSRVVIPVKPAEEWLCVQARAEKAKADRMADELLQEFDKK